MSVVPSATSASTRGNLAWSAVEAAVSGLLSAASAFVVARLIGPAEVGVGAASVAVNVMLWVLVNAVFADAIVQAPDIDRGRIRAALQAGVLLGILAAAAQAGAGRLLLATIGDARLPSMALLLALPLPLVGAAGVAQGVLTRARRYRALAGRAVIGQALGTAAGIGTALAGGGAWSLVLQQAVTIGVGALVLVVRAPWHVLPPGEGKPSRLRALLSMGAALAVGTLVQTGRYRVFALAVGGFGGTAVLGQVHTAFRMVDTVRDLLLSALWRLMLPVMSERQHDVPRLQTDLDRFLALIGLVLFPLFGAMALGLRPLTALLLGPAWDAAGQTASVLALLLGYIFLGFPGGVACVARGQAGAALFAQIVGAVAVLVAVVLVRPTTPIAAAEAWLLAHALAAPVALWTTSRAVNAAMLRHWRAGLKALAVAGAATLAGWLVPNVGAGPIVSPATLLVVRLGVLSVAYGLGASMLLRPSVRDALRVAGVGRWRAALA